MINKPVDYLGAYASLADMNGLTRTEVPLEILFSAMAETKKLESKVAELEAKELERRAEMAKQRPEPKTTPKEFCDDCGFRPSFCECNLDEKEEEDS